MNLIRGMRDKLSKYIDVTKDISIRLTIDGTDIYDFCCFGVDSEDILQDDRYMIFYNQLVSPNQEISYQSGNNHADFKINLSALPTFISKLVFTVSIDGVGTMGEITSHHFSLFQDGTTYLELDMSGSQFHQEKAIISVEIYRKEEWRIYAVANGFNGGLSALLESFGGEEIKEETALVLQTKIKVSLKKTEEELTQEVMNKISLSKDKVKLEKHVVNLSKCMIDISQRNGVDLGSQKAKVVVVLDYSGSMRNLYKNGTVQNTINRLVPLGLTFDDNGSIDMYLFQTDYRKMDDISLDNYENYITSVVNTSGYRMGQTNYAPVLNAIINGENIPSSGILGVFGKMNHVNGIVDEVSPTFVLFITDGANADKAKTTAVIKQSSEMNVFIQFIGIGKEQFEYLERLDRLPGRKIDNTGFSKMSSLEGASDMELYTNVLEEFSHWLKR